MEKKCIKAYGLFRRAARAWEVGNNSGNSREYAAGEKKCEKLRSQAEALLAPWGVKVDYPGLYPRFQFQGRDYHDLESVARAVAEAN